MRRSSEQSRGAAVVEFAVVLPLLLIIVFGIIEFGFLWLQSHYIANSAREGARVAARLHDVDDGDGQWPYAQIGVYNHLRGLPLYGGLTHSGKYELENPSVLIEVDDGISLGDFGGPDQPAVRVTVTVQTHEAWQPILWGFLAGLFGGTEITLNEISESAVFARQ